MSHRANVGRIGHRLAVGVLILVLQFLGACGPKRPAQAIAEFPPTLPAKFGDIPVNGGRTQSIAVHPEDPGRIVIATQWGGLWKKVGSRWVHLIGLPAFTALDVAYSPDGRTLYATLAYDNRTDNGGGIWLSHDDGANWFRPATAVTPPPALTPPARPSAYGIAVDRYRSNRVYVATDYGIAISEDAGATWRHRRLTPPWASARSVLDLPSNVVLATSAWGVHRSADGGSTWTTVRTGDFCSCPSPFSAGFSFKTMDNAERVAYPFGRPPRAFFQLNTAPSKLVLILQNVSTLFLYDDADQSFTPIPTPPGQSRGPFVRVSAADDRESIFVWVGTGVNLLRAKAARTRAALAAIKLSDWQVLGRANGLHDDTGYLGVDTAKRPVLFGSDGGIFRPTNADWSQWVNAATGRSGWNSLQITDLGGTNTEPRPNLFVNSLYFSTQDNAIWASSDGGLTWPASDCTEGFHVEVRKDAPAHRDVQVAYGKLGCGPSSTMFSDAHLTNLRAIPDVDAGGGAINGLGNATLISPGRYMRTRWVPPATTEIWVSRDSGATWRHRYTLGSGIGPAAAVAQFTENTERGYLPVTGAATDASGNPRVGLMPLVTPFAPGVTTLGQDSIRYLPNGGSLGIRATEFDWQAVFGLHRTDRTWLIAPDVINGVVMVSRTSGRTWTPDPQLTAEVTRNGALLLYGGDPYRMQVTHISFDPYNTNQILVGTRDAGIIMSDDGGGRWWTLRLSWGMLYATGFFFRRDDMAIASSYGRGLWVLNLRYRPRGAAVEKCDLCTIVEIGTGRKLQGVPKDADSLIATGGSITGARVRGGRLEAISLSPGARWARYLDVTKPATEIAVESTNLSGGLRRLVRDLPAGHVVNGFVLRDTVLVAAIVGPAALPLPTNPPPPPEDPRDVDVDTTDVEPRPFVSAMTDIHASGRAILGHDGEVQIVGGNFRPNAPVHIRLDGRSIQGSPITSDANGSFTTSIRDTRELAYGEHVIEALQGESRAQTRFLKAHLDRFDQQPRARGVP